MIFGTDIKEKSKRIEKNGLPKSISKQEKIKKFEGLDEEGSLEEVTMRRKNLIKFIKSKCIRDYKNSRSKKYIN
jgi:hypothetical protein